MFRGLSSIDACSRIPSEAVEERDKDIFLPRRFDEPCSIATGALRKVTKSSYCFRTIWQRHEFTSQPYTSRNLLMPALWATPAGCTILLCRTHNKASKYPKPRSSFQDFTLADKIKIRKIFAFGARLCSSQTAEICRYSLATPIAEADLYAIFLREVDIVLSYSELANESENPLDLWWSSGLCHGGSLGRT